MKHSTKSRIAIVALVASLVIGVAVADAGKRRVVKFTDHVSIVLNTAGNGKTASDSVSGQVTSNKVRCYAKRAIALVLDPGSKGDPNLYQRVGYSVTDANGNYSMPIPNINAADSYFTQIDRKRIFRTRHKIGVCLAASSSLVHK